MRGAWWGLLALGSQCSDYNVNRTDRVDVFLQTPAEQVDILLVIDNSGSMQPYQEELGRRFGDFIRFFIDADVDYQIGVITTTVLPPETDPIPFGCTTEDLAAIPEPGHLVDGQIIDADTPDAEAVFADLVGVGTCGSTFEMGMEAAALALSPELLREVNAGFIRTDAELTLIFVSDEEDASPMPVSEYVNTFREAKGLRASRGAYNASALTALDVDACGQIATTASDRYTDLADQSEGIIGDLCEADFTDVVTELSFNASRLEDTFVLTGVPDLRSLTVQLDDGLSDCDDGVWRFTFDELGEPVIVFDRLSLPRPGARISVRYNLGSGDESFCIEGAE